MAWCVLVRGVEWAGPGWAVSAWRAIVRMLVSLGTAERAVPTVPSHHLSLTNVMPMRTAIESQTTYWRGMQGSVATPSEPVPPSAGHNGARAGGSTIARRITGEGMRVLPPPATYGSEGLRLAGLCMSNVPGRYRI